MEEQRDPNCEECGEEVKWLAAECPCCNEKVLWVRADGKKMNHWYPRTRAGTYLFGRTRFTKEFRSEAERNAWERLEEEVGADIIIPWIDWAVGKRIPSSQLVERITTCVRRYGELGGSTEGVGKETWKATS
tara:strand:+ start:1663 stop:2058 length:396 start_codon:yes stop_codon:yes gene_type:complete